MAAAVERRAPSGTARRRDRLRRPTLTLLLGLLLCAPLPAQRSPHAAEPHAALPSSAPWTSLAPGLEIAFFGLPADEASRDSALTVLRVDPRHWQLRLLCASATADMPSLTAKQWSELHELAAATNAGMFAADGRTHVGYLRNELHVNSAAKNQYQSVAAFSPKVSHVPAFRIFDLEHTNFDTILKQYDCVVQNLRLIKRPRENRWSPQPRKWSEAALGEDAEGRALLIFCRMPLAMHDFNQLLLSLPLDLVSAQHLEGGPEAQLYVKHGDFVRECVGSYETCFLPNAANETAWPIPNVLGVAPVEEDGGR
jgi:hypothetical protein